MGIFNYIKNFFQFNMPDTAEPFILDNDTVEPAFDVRTENMELPKKQKIDPDINLNLEYIKNRFNVPDNSDVVIRELMIGGDIPCFILFIDGMVNTELIDLGVIQPILNASEMTQVKEKSIADIVEHKVLYHSQVSRTYDMDTVIDAVNFGCVGLFLDGADVCFSLDLRGWGHRGIDKPENEQSIYGPQEAFAEMLRNNTALIRKTLKTEKLICEDISVGTVSKTKGVIMYISDIANDELVKEVRRRVNGVSIDYVISIEEVAMLMEERTYMVTSHVLSTERPDRAARALTEGRVVMIINGSPRALIMPTNAFELTHGASDAYMRVPFANMTRIVRLIAMSLSLLLPALYLAITLFHQEMIPTDLLYSISASRESVPFPSLLELLLMEISFEMIREAGIRMPGPIGSTLGIVGGLILGQAAVSAKIVSPIMIIIIAVTGIGSFATSNYSLGWSYRVLRLGFLLLGSILGFYGISMGVFAYSVFLAAQKSFGVPFLSPTAKDTRTGVLSSVFVKSIWKSEKRPSFLMTKDQIQEPKVSRKWNMKRKKK